MHRNPEADQWFERPAIPSGAMMRRAREIILRADECAA
jgi:hypothetical protein